MNSSCKHSLTSSQHWIGQHHKLPPKQGRQAQLHQNVLENCCSDSDAVTIPQYPVWQSRKIKSFKKEPYSGCTHTNTHTQGNLLPIYNAYKRSQKPAVQILLNQWNGQHSSMKFNKRVAAYLRIFSNCGGHHVFYRMLGVEVLLQIRVNSWVLQAKHFCLLDSVKR